jgi:hypothetical protein
MHAKITGTGAGLTFSVAARARMMQGAGQYCLDEDARPQAEYFVEVLNQTAERCDWRIVPTGEEKATATRTVKTDSGRELTLEIGWPEPNFSGQSSSWS